MPLMRNEPVQLQMHPAPRHEAVSAIGVATVVAALHLAALACRWSARCPRGRYAAVQIWQPPPAGEAPARHEPDRVPSNPTHSYSAGRLALTAGMVIVALAFQLHVMRVGAALAR